MTENFLSRASDLKRKIEREKSEMIRAKTLYESAISKLKQWGFKSVAEAKKSIEEKQRQKDALSKKLEGFLDELEEVYR